MTIERRLSRVLAWATGLCVACAATAVVAGPAADALDALIAAYPDALSRHDGAHIYWRDGTSMAVSDGRTEKTYQELLKDASILDQFRLPYPRGQPSAPPEPNADPGRFRNEGFFRKMYGDCTRGEVDRNLVSIVWLPKSSGKVIKVSKVNGIAKRLAAVSAEIDGLPDAIRHAAYPTAGVLSCRPVADTGRMSMHGYAAAIDLNVRISDYWLWQPRKPGAAIPYRNRMPYAIVDIFEHHGFIWGGKWYHYDTMHFEYRPELVGMSEN